LRLAALSCVLAVLMAGCGSAARQDAAEPDSTFHLQVTQASFPSAQKLSDHVTLTIAVRNVDSRAIPDLAVTICNVTCHYPAPPGEGTSSGAFASNAADTSLANPSRPVWVVDRPPGDCSGGYGFSCQSGSGGGEATAYSNTWALGKPLAPGATALFKWSVTAVKAGHFVLAWQLAAGLNGKAKAALAGGGTPAGTFAVTISNKPQQSYVTDAGQIVTTP
jgi:hypothetical protein